MYLYRVGLRVSISTPILQRRVCSQKAIPCFILIHPDLTWKVGPGHTGGRTSLYLMPEGSHISLPFQSVGTESQSRMRHLGLGSLCLPTTEGFQSPQQVTHTISEFKHLELVPRFSHQNTWIS